MTTPNDHFQGKSVPEHLKEARLKGAQAAAELHGLEVSGLKAAFVDAVRDGSMAAAFLFIPLCLVPSLSSCFVFGYLFLLGWVIWKTCRSAALGWARLGKLHRVISEERWEIEHNREQEREELQEVYQARGFSEPLLTQVIDVLMADDNRLLQVMLDEELGLPLEAYEHPLKQAFGAFLGALIPTTISFLVCRFFCPTVLLTLLLVSFILSSLWMTKLERGSLIHSFVWNLAIFGLCTGSLYFLTKLFLNFLP